MATNISPILPFPPLFQNRSPVLYNVIIVNIRQLSGPTGVKIVSQLKTLTGKGEWLVL